MPLTQHLVSESIALTCLMDELAESEEYMSKAASQGDTELRDIIAGIAEASYELPNEAVLLRISDAVLDEFLHTYVGKLELSAVAIETVRGRVLSTIPYTLNARQSMSSAAGTSVLSVSKMFIAHKDFAVSTYVILLYDGHASATLIREMGDEIAGANAMFVFFDADMQAAIQSRMAEEYFVQVMSIGGIEIEYISGEAIAAYR